MCFLLSMTNSLLSQRFPCIGNQLIASYDGSSTKIFNPITIMFSPPFLSPIAGYSNVEFDALGFNPADNFIYAVQKNTNAIVRLKSNNTYDTVGIVSLVDELQSNAGDFSTEGYYMLYESALKQILVYDVENGLELIRRIDLFWNPSSMNRGPFETEIFDFAIDPRDPGIAYSFQSNFEDEDFEPAESQGFILRINLDLDDINLGMVTPVVGTDKRFISHIGGMTYNAQSMLFAYGSKAFQFLPDQTILYALDLSTGETTEYVSSGPRSISSDGCSCPYSFSFTSRVPEEGMFCNNEEKDFILTIRNNSPQRIENVTLRDTLPDGMMINDVTGVVGNVSNFVVPTNILEITELVIPAFSTVDVKISVVSVDAVVGLTYNQAFLYNLPERFGGEFFPSDNTSTVSEQGDKNVFFVIARPLEEATWDIKNPTDCIDANDGQISLQSPQFFPGQEYEVKLRNRIGWEESTFNVRVDQNNSFVMDSLLPGEYQIFQIKTALDNCSLAVQDTFVTLLPPNDRLRLEAFSNSPICEGDALEFRTEIFPEGNVRWTGPSSYGTENPNPTLDSTSTENSGIYKAKLTVGFCYQEREVEGIVRPTINAEISGNTIYCERDQLELEVDGAGEELQHVWTSPSSGISLDSIYLIDSVSQGDEGYYEVISDNGSCRDTVGVFVEVLDTPTLSLADEIFTNFCDPVILSTEIQGALNINYRWSPEEGLSCTDCLRPEVIPIVQSEYTLIAENENSCIDSTTVQISLDESSLVYAPNIFTPKSQNSDNAFTLYEGCVIQQITTLNIYNRWGNKVFSSTTTSIDDQLDMWNGFVQGTRARPGVYVWTAEVVLVDGSTQKLSGDVTLLY